MHARTLPPPPVPVATGPGEGVAQPLPGGGCQAAGGAYIKGERYHLSVMAYLTDPTGRGRKARTITATDPLTGAELTRRTDRVYVAAVVTDDLKGQAYAVAWAGRPDLAAKALAQRGGAANGYRLAPVTGDPWATPDPAPEPTPATAAPVAAADPLPTLAEAQAAQAARRPVLPGEATPPPAPSHGEAAPTLPRLRADAAAGRPVSLAGLARALGRDLALASGGRLPVRYGASGDPAFTPPSDPLEGQPWDPGTPEARARVALQGERVATLWPIAQAVRGAGLPLPGSWASDGPVMAGERTYGQALASLTPEAIRAAAAALAALPPVTVAQDRALELCRGWAVPVA
jgi:hypothetical protein